MTWFRFWPKTKSDSVKSRKRRKKMPLLAWHVPLVRLRQPRPRAASPSQVRRLSNESQFHRRWWGKAAPLGLPPHQVPLLLPVVRPRRRRSQLRTLPHLRLPEQRRGRLFSQLRSQFLLFRLALGKRLAWSFRQSRLSKAPRPSLLLRPPLLRLLRLLALARTVPLLLTLPSLQARPASTKPTEQEGRQLVLQRLPPRPSHRMRQLQIG